MSRTRMERVRLGSLLAFVCVFFFVVVARLAQMQLSLGEKYGEIVRKQSSGRVEIPALRGNIYDRNGLPVVQTVYGHSLYAYARTEDELTEACQYVEKLFGLKRGAAKKDYKLELHRFRWIDRRLTDEQADHVDTDRPKGLFLRDEQIREYPFGLIGRQIVGFTNIDNQGQSGLELQYDSMLCGTSGWADILKDGRQDSFKVKEEALIQPTPGKGLLLTIDWRLQEIVEEELRRSVESHKAKSANAVFIDPASGDILAIAHYDPSEKYPERPTKLRPVSDLFEPGSVFKAVTAAGLLDADLVDFNELIFCENGVWNLGGKPLHDDKKHGFLTFREVIELSSNIGIGKKAFALGGDRLYETAKKFGFGKRFNIGFPAEAKGSIAHPERWSERTTAALSMGHAISCTPLQMAASMAAIANGGDLMRPRLIRGLVEPDGAIQPFGAAEKVTTALKEVSADSLRAFLRGVVERGTAKDSVNSPTVLIAGKTGTAEIPNPTGRGYLKHKFNASFAGFFPSDRPLVAGIVVIEQPEPMHYGGWTSGPAFRRIAERYAVLEPQRFVVPEKSLHPAPSDPLAHKAVPDFVGRQTSYAQSVAKFANVELTIGDSSGIVEWQFPPAGTRSLSTGNVIAVANASQSNGMYTMADLTGRTVKEAAAYLAHVGVSFSVTGSGRIYSQSILPGELLSAASICKLDCTPPKDSL